MNSFVASLTTSRLEAQRWRQCWNTIYADCLRRTNGNTQKATRMASRYFDIWGAAMGGVGA